MNDVDKLIDMLDIPADAQQTFRQVMATPPGPMRNESLDRLRKLCGPRLNFQAVLRAIGQ